MASRGFIPSAHTLSVRIVSGPSDVASALGAEGEDLMEVRRLLLADNTPMAVQHGYLPIWVMGNEEFTATDLHNKSLYKTRRNGRHPILPRRRRPSKPFPPITSVPACWRWRRDHLSSGRPACPSIGPRGQLNGFACGTEPTGIASEWSCSAMIDVVGERLCRLGLSVPAVPEPDQKVHTQQVVVEPGRGGAHVAVALARLGSQVALHARIGQDAFGSMILETLGREAVEATSVVVDTSISTYFTMSLITDDSPEKRMVVAVTPGLYPEKPHWA